MEEEHDILGGALKGTTISEKHILNIRSISEDRGLLRNTRVCAWFHVSSPRGNRSSEDYFSPSNKHDSVETGNGNSGNQFREIHNCFFSLG